MQDNFVFMTFAVDSACSLSPLKSLFRLITRTRIRTARPVKYILVVLFIVIAVTHMGSRRSGAAQSGPDRDPAQKTDALYGEMGVLKVPRIAVPVDFSLMDIDGRTVRLSDFKGKVVFLNFWATWCPPCKIEMPSMQRLYDTLKHRNFTLVAVDLQEPPPPVKKFVRKYKLTFPVLLDMRGEVGRRFGIRSIPTTFILDGEGAIIGKAFGPRDWDSEKSIELFEHLMALETE